MKNKAAVYLLLVLTTAVWGFQPVCVKWLLREWTPVTITAARLGIFSLLLLAFARVREGRRMLPQREQGKGLFILGLTYMLNNVLQFSGISYTTVANVTLICAMGPVLTALLAAAFLRERLPLLAWGGIAVSLAGSLTVITGGDVSVLTGFRLNGGDILCFAAQLCWTIYALVSINLLKSLSVVAVTGWSALVSSLLTALWGLAGGGLSVTPLSLPAFGSFLFTIFAGGIFAMLSWNFCIKSVGPGVASVFLNIMPVVGIVSGCLLLGETVDAVRLAGAAAIITGVYLTTRGAG